MTGPKWTVRCILFNTHTQREMRFVYQQQPVFTIYSIFVVGLGLQVYEKPLEALGQIRELYKARGRGRLLECTLCKELGATVDCRVGKCDEVFHFQVRRFSFLPQSAL